MKSISIILFVSFMVAITGCDFQDFKLVVRNDTDSALIVLIDEPDYFPTGVEEDSAGQKKLNDSLLDTKAMITNYDHRGGAHFLAAHSSNKIGAFNTTWDGIIDRLPNQKLGFAFFPSYILNSGKYTRCEIWRNKLYLKKKEFSKAEMEKMDWVVVYDNK